MIEEFRRLAGAMRNLEAEMGVGSNADVLSAVLDVEGAAASLRAEATKAWRRDMEYYSQQPQHRRALPCIEGGCPDPATCVRANCGRSA